MSKLEDSLFEEFRLFGLDLPERQHRFHPKRKWQLDFAWIDRKIAVEIHGGIYMQGHHSRGQNQEDDFEKVNEAVRLGWRVFVFGPKWCRRKKRTMQSSDALAFLHGVLGESVGINGPAAEAMR